MNRVRRRSGNDKGWDQVVPNARARLMLSARQAAQKVVATVEEIGPNYSGAFKERWLVQPLGPSVEQPIEGGFVPLLRANNAPETGYSIRNESPYAAQALDLEPGIFFKPPGQPEPKGKVVDRGIREEGPTMRGDVEDSDYGNSVSTAERDWYERYAKGGQFARDVRDGARSKIRRPR